MLITKRTRTRDLLPLLDRDGVERLLDAVEEVPLDKPLIEMTIAEFAEATGEGYIGSLMRERYAWRAFGKLKSLKRQSDEIERYLGANEVKPSKEHERAAIGVEFPDAVEQMLMTVCEYFHLGSFDEAEKVKISNYMLIQRKQSAEMKYRHQWDAIMEQKNRARNGGRRGK